MGMSLLFCSWLKIAALMGWATGRAQAANLKL